MLTDPSKQDISHLMLMSLQFITAKLDVDLKANSDASGIALYSETKFAQLLGAHWWRRQLGDSCHVVAVSPGLIPETRLSRYYFSAHPEGRTLI